MKEKFALVTGSGRGIGKAVAVQLAKDGFTIFVHFRQNEKKAGETAQEIEKYSKAYLAKGELTDDKQRQNIFKQIQKVTDSLDVLVNSAGFDYGYLIEDYTLEQVEYLTDINLVQKIMMTKYALPFLKKSGSPAIINISSRMGKEKTIRGIGAYGPAEAGVIKFTQCCALEFSEYKIRVNCVAPGLTDTEMSRSITTDQKVWDALAKTNPSGRVGQPQDIANVVSFLVSEKANYINGETIGVNGGSNLV